MPSIPPGLPPRSAPDPAVPLPLTQLVTEADLAPDDAATPALLRVTDDPLRVTRLLIDGNHPLDVLMGLTAPPDWAGIGLRCQGHAYDLTQLERNGAAQAGSGLPTEPPPDPPRTCESCRPSGDADNPWLAPTADADGRPVTLPVVVTLLVDRTGQGAGALRRGAAVTRLTGPPEGMVGDACRRALGLRTPAAPETTVELWVRLWLDRLLDLIAHHDDSEWPRTWGEVADLHPVAPGQPTALHANRRSTRAAGALSDGYMLADATVQLAAAWPWQRLRDDPEVIDTARPPMSRHLAQWMDDGMFARWLLNDTADIGRLSTPLSHLLPGPVVAGIAETVTTLGFAWPPPAPADAPAGDDAEVDARPAPVACSSNGEAPR